MLYWSLNKEYVAEQLLIEMTGKLYMADMKIKSIVLDNLKHIERVPVLPS